MLSGLETLNGITRQAVLVSLLGKKAALKLSLLTGAVLAFVACYLMIPSMAIFGTGSQFALGLLLTLYMSSFDILLGRLLLRRPWKKILADFNPLTGNYLLFGLLLLLLYPWLVMQLQAVISD